MVCSYLISHCCLTPDAALASFARSRPPGVKHQRFIDELHRRYDALVLHYPPTPCKSCCFSCLAVAAAGKSSSSSSSSTSISSSSSSGSAAAALGWITVLPVGLDAAAPHTTEVEHKTSQAGCIGVALDASPAAQEPAVTQSVAGLNAVNPLCETTPSSSSSELPEHTVSASAISPADGAGEQVSGHGTRTISSNGLGGVLQGKKQGVRAGDSPVQLRALSGDGRTYHAPCSRLGLCSSNGYSNSSCSYCYEAPVASQQQPWEADSCGEAGVGAAAADVGVGGSLHAAGGEGLEAAGAAVCARPPRCRVQFADTTVAEPQQQQQQQQVSHAAVGLFPGSSGVYVQQQRQQQQKQYHGLGLRLSPEDETKAMHMGRFLAGVSPARGASPSCAAAPPSSSYGGVAMSGCAEAPYSCSTTLGNTSSPASAAATADSDCAGSSGFWLVPELGLDLEQLHFHRSASNVSNSSFGCSLLERLPPGGGEGAGGRTESAVSLTAWEAEGASDAEEEAAVATAVGVHVGQGAAVGPYPLPEAMAIDAAGLQPYQQQRLGGKGNSSSSSSRLRGGLGHGASAAAAALVGHGSCSMPDMSMLRSGSSSSWGALGSSPPVGGGSCGGRYGSGLLPGAQEENESFGQLVGMELMTNAR